MDIEALFRSLDESRVDFVIIGATAFPIHGYARATLDVDLFIRPDVDNARRTLEALRRFGYNVSEISVDDLLDSKVLIRQYLVETDIHPFVKGVSFDQVWANKVKGTYGAQHVWYASLDDLIAMKSAAGRVKDREDLKALRALKKEGMGKR